MRTSDTTPRLRLILFLVFASLLGGPPVFGSPGRVVDDDTDQALQSTDPTVQPGVILVRVRAGTAVQTGVSKSGISSLDRLGRTYDVRSIEKTFPFLDAIAARRELSPVTRSLRRVYTIRYHAPVPPEEVTAQYAEDPHIVLAEPQYLRRLTDLPAAPGARQTVSGPADPQAVPNDSLYDEMTHLPQIRMPEAWDVTRGEAGNVVVAVVDGGTAWEHPDLEANVWTNEDEVPDNGMDDDDNGYVDDIHGWNFATDGPDPTGPTPENALHGTAVAGVVSGISNNEIGIAGNSWNATFMPVGAGCEDPSFDGSVCYGLQGLLYAAFNGAEVINASWSGVGFSQVAEDVIASVRGQGALVVAAAGNAGENIDRSPTFPASNSGVLAVGATRKSSNQVTGFSNFGESVDIFAPGARINTTVPEEEGEESYATISGTSFSAPLVSGIAALVKTQFPDYSLEQVREQVRVTSRRIDAENMGFNGHLGQGRVDALRALTATDIPSVRARATAMIDADSDSLAEPGESIDLSVTFTNYLTAASSVSAELVANDTLVSVIGGTASLGAMATGATREATFIFEVAEDAPQGRQVVLYLETTADGQQNTDVVRVVLNPAQAIEHNTEPLRVSITSEGNIGFVTFADPPSPGVGFSLNGRNLLFEGGLLVGTGPGRISDCIRGSDPNVVQEDDFVQQPGTQMEIVRPGEYTTEEGLVSLVDDSADDPIGVSIRQETYVDETDANNESIVFRYVIRNRDTSAITDLHAGIFLDWDVDANDSSTDLAKFDEDRRLGYVFDNPSPTALGALKLLTTEGDLSYRAIDNEEEIYQQTAGGFSSTEKWNFMSGGIQTRTLDNKDVSHLMASGPYSIEPGASVEIAYAVVGGETEASLLQNADNVQNLWNETLSKISVGIERPAPAAPTASSLDAVYPNPTPSSAMFTYQVAQPGRVQLTVYDLLGRRVRTLVADRRRSGTHEVTWNGLNDLGHRVANGVYLIRLSVRADGRQYAQTRTLTLVR